MFRTARDAVYTRRCRSASEAELLLASGIGQRFASEHAPPRSAHGGVRCGTVAQRREVLPEIAIDWIMPNTHVRDCVVGAQQVRILAPTVQCFGS
jgi:hypothetical protein